MTSQTYIDFNQSVWWPPIFSEDESFAFDVHSISRIWNVCLTGAQTKFNHKIYWVSFVFHICFVKNRFYFEQVAVCQLKIKNSIVSLFLFFYFHFYPQNIFSHYFALFQSKMKKKMPNILLDAHFFAQTTAPLSERKNVFSKFQPIQSIFIVLFPWLFLYLNFFLSFGRDFFFLVFFSHFFFGCCLCKLRLSEECLIRNFVHTEKISTRKQKKIVFFSVVFEL